METVKGSPSGRTAKSKRLLDGGVSARSLSKLTAAFGGKAGEIAVRKKMLRSMLVRNRHSSATSVSVDA